MPTTRSEPPTPTKDSYPTEPPTATTAPTTQMKTPDFLTQKKKIAAFLLMTLFFAVLFLVFYKPVGSGRSLSFIKGVSFVTYATVITGIGLVVISLSRVLLYRVQQRAKLTLWQYVAWIGVELIMLAGGLAGLANHLNTNPTLNFFDLAKQILVDIISILAIPYTISILIALLQEKNSRLQEMEQTLSQHEATPIALPDVLTFYTQSGRFALSVKVDNVLYIEASDNYVDLHYLNNGTEDIYVLHNTMKNLSQAYANSGLVRCHRGFMVNIHKVKMARRHKDGLLLDIFDSPTPIPVTKTYAETVLSLFSSVDNG